MHITQQDVDGARRQLIDEITTALPRCDGDLAGRIAAELKTLQSGPGTPEALELSAWRLRELAGAVEGGHTPLATASAALIVALGVWVSGG